MHDSNELTKVWCGRHRHLWAVRQQVVMMMRVVVMLIVVGVIMKVIVVLMMTRTFELSDWEVGKYFANLN